MFPGFAASGRDEGHASGVLTHAILSACLVVMDWYPSRRGMSSNRRLI